MPADAKETYENWTDVLVSRLRLQDVTTLKLQCRSPAEVAKVAAELEANRSLVELDMTHSDVDAEGAEAVVAAVRNNKGLLKIDLSHNPNVTTEAVAGLRTMLQSNNTLFHFGLDGTAVDEETKATIASDLILNSYPVVIKRGIQVLEQGLYEGTCTLDFPFVKDDPRKCRQNCIDRLARAVTGKPVVSLSMVGHTHGLDVAELLKGLQSGALVSLKLETCGISDADVTGVLCDLVRASPKLHHICLKNNAIGGDGAEALIAALEGSRVQKVCLDREKLPAACAARLDAAVGANHLPPKLRQALPQLLANAPRLTHVDLKGSETKRVGIMTKEEEARRQQARREHIPEAFDAAALRVLAAALERNYNVTSLDLSCNALTAGACGVLVPVLARSSSLRMVNLSCNMLGDAGAALLKPAVEASRTLHSVDLSDNKIAPQLEAQISSACFRNAMVHSGRVASHAPPRELTHPPHLERPRRPRPAAEVAEVS